MDSASVKEMVERLGVRETAIELCRSPSTMGVEERILSQVEIRVRHRAVEHVLLQRGWTVKQSREERRDECVSGGLKREVPTASWISPAYHPSLSSS